MTDKPAREKAIKSPCVSVCVLDDNDVCRGCYRTGDEINEWFQCDNEGKKCIIKKAQERYKSINKNFLL